MKKIAFWFRYGPAEHAELFHASPDIVTESSRHAEFHYYGLRSRKEVPLRSGNTPSSTTCRGPSIAPRPAIGS